MSDAQARSVAEGPWVRYAVTTALGSFIDIYFRHTHDILSSQPPHEVLVRAGEMRVGGYAASVSSEVDIAGVGFEPEVDGQVAVGSSGTNDDGTSRLITELIVSIRHVEEVSTPQP